MESIHGVPMDESKVLAFKEVEDAPLHKLTLDISRWSYQDYGDFLRLQQAGNWRRALPLIMQIVVAWTYDIPVGPDAWHKLPFPALPVVAKSVRSTLDAYVENVDVTDVRVDLDKWTMDEYFDFQDASTREDLAAYERLIRLVANYKELPPKGRLTFEQGTVLTKAVTEATIAQFGQGK